MNKEESFNFVVFYLASIILFQNFVIHFHLKGIFHMLKYFVSASFSKEMPKLFSGSARTSANN